LLVVVVARRLDEDGQPVRVEARPRRRGGPAAAVVEREERHHRAVLRSARDERSRGIARQENRVGSRARGARGTLGRGGGRALLGAGGRGDDEERDAERVMDLHGPISCAAMSQDLSAARSESARVLDLIGKKTLTQDEQSRVIADSVRYWTDYINPGFLEYRKSVSTDYTAVEWSDDGAVFRDVKGKEF